MTPTSLQHAAADIFSPAVVEQLAVVEDTCGGRDGPGGRGNQRGHAGAASARVLQSQFADEKRLKHALLLGDDTEVPAEFPGYAHNTFGLCAG